MTKHSTRILAICAAVAGTVLTASPSLSGEVSQSTQFFAVHGGSLAEIDRSLSQSGPMISGSGQRHPGATSVQFDGRVSYKRVNGGCAVDRTEIKLKLKTTLPKWYRPKRVDGRTALVWRTLAADIQRHEKKHSDIAISYLKRLESALKNLRTERTCRQMEAVANTVMSRYLADHERAQREFDVIEGREVNLRLNRALQRSLYSAPR
ncbi:hypothetical protein FP2506_14654 [Fulvimarina pelagi HTCC2506]|uniref:Secreted Zn-dependent protease n=1 Tax=Fulvimarina pelagi HTCC2506 TaxID=314231 RepID=Q0G3Z9_9HYPH|nr:DUF922 domain-containing protein [Fulvimarina pelagi]EAU41682.1 hypothetical protein FP2506_14654 [Fulvimarina pelagi HTCC2506]